MQPPPPAYGLWSLVIINSLVFIIFAFNFAKPQSRRDWRSFGAFSAFLVRGRHPLAARSGVARRRRRNAPAEIPSPAARRR